MYEQAKAADEIIKSAHKIVIVQADNPDADSLGSALALEQILGEMDKETALYCAVDIPSYLKYMPGWDRVEKDLPNKFDASIIVDASTMTLLEKLSQSGKQGWLAAKPCLVLDHHQTVEKVVPFATVMINDHTRASAGELIYILAKQLKWPLNNQAREVIMSSILGDTQGLTNQLASSETYRIMAEMLDEGVSRSELEETRREYGKMPEVIYKYKAELIRRTEFSHDSQIALVVVPQDEITKFSPLYNPAPLIQNDMLQVRGVRLAIVLKSYDDGHSTGAIRASIATPIAGKLAEKMGGGGHDFASGFKINQSRPINEVKSECLKFAGELIDQL